MLQKAKNFFIRGKKTNNTSYPQSLQLFPTGDKPIIYANEAILYYLECAPVHTAIDKITKEFSSIPIRIYDKKQEKYIDDHPSLELLHSPDGDITYKEFAGQLAKFYYITGNTYLRAVGFIENPPKELRIAPSQAVTINVGFDAYPFSITSRILSLMDTFLRTEVDYNGRPSYRYYANEFKELWHIKTFNPANNSMMAYGISPFNAVFYEIRQYIESAKYNLSALQRSSRISGIFKVKERILTADQRAAMKQEINYGIEGSNNAGRNLLLDRDIDFQDLITNSRDMDYSIMKKQVTEAIYNALDIPLPIISADHMTLANFEGAKVFLYQNAVIPLAKRLFEELTNFLMPRYKNSENMIFTFNEEDIPALEPKRNEQTNLMKEAGIFTINELRRRYAAEPVEGGNSVYGQATMFPLANDVSGTFQVGELDDDDEDEEENNNETDNEQIDASDNDFDDLENNNDPDEDQNENSNNKPDKNKFMEILKRQVNKDGTRRFTDETIEEIAGKYYDNP